MPQRMKNQAVVIPDVMRALRALAAAAMNGGVTQRTTGLFHLRVSRINASSHCIASGTTFAKKEGESDDRLFTVSAWKISPLCSDAERGALAEAATRLADLGTRCRLGTTRQALRRDRARFPDPLDSYLQRLQPAERNQA